MRLKNPGFVKKRFFGIGKSPMPQNDRVWERFFGVGKPAMPQNDLLTEN